MSERFGIIGGGAGGLEIAKLFLKSGRKIQFLVDRNPQAVGMLFAQESGIRTFTDLERALREPVDFIVEVTGSKAVMETIRQQVDEKTEVIGSKGALMLFSTVQALDEARHNVFQEIDQVRSGIVSHVESVQEAAQEINTLTGELQVLALNARIEAARAGRAGDGFGVVANEVKQLASRAKGMAAKVAAISGEILAMSQKIGSQIDP